MSQAPRPDPRQLVASPEWHLFDFNIAQRKFVFQAMSEQDYRESIFLDGRIRSTRKQRISLGLAPTVQLFLGEQRPKRPLAFIFHVGHCGSTLLSRALGDFDAVLPLREPKTLKFLSATLRELGHPVCLFTERNFEQLREVILAALSRPFRPGQRAVVKATSTCNNLILPILDTSAGTRAVLLYHPLEQHIAGRLPPSAGTVDLIAQSRERMLDWCSIPDALPLQNSQLAPEQFAVLTWLTSMYFMVQARQRRPKRTLLVDFEDFLADPDDRLPRISGFLGLDIPVDDLLAHYAEVSQHYSKMPGKQFTAGDRKERQDKARHQRADQIQRGMRWAEQLVRSVPVLEPVGKLIG